MNKKILALALAIVFIATAFTACKQEYEMMKIGGKEYPIARDKEGNTIINEQNQIAILVTDSNEEVIKYENGEDQTYWVQLHSDLVSDDSIQNKDYKLGVPEGWTGLETGRITKNGTDDKCCIYFGYVTKVTKETTLETILEKLNEENAAAAAELERQGQTVEIDEKTVTVTDKNISCNFLAYKITDENGKVIHYAENGLFEANKVIYQIAYVCMGGEGYDETFNFEQYVRENFTFKGNI